MRRTNVGSTMDYKDRPLENAKIRFEIVNSPIFFDRLNNSAVFLKFKMIHVRNNINLKA